MGLLLRANAEAAPEEGKEPLLQLAVGREAPRRLAQGREEVGDLGALAEVACELLLDPPALAEPMVDERLEEVGREGGVEVADAARAEELACSRQRCGREGREAVR